MVCVLPLATDCTLRESQKKPLMSWCIMVLIINTKSEKEMKLLIMGIGAIDSYQDLPRLASSPVVPATL